MQFLQTLLTIAMAIGLAAAVPQGPPSDPRCKAGTCPCMCIADQWGSLACPDPKTAGPLCLPP
ncbi:unnamed protein product [Cercospora beticola]|nr:unnamed protein product [Cercospora beticola]